MTTTEYKAAHLVGLSDAGKVWVRTELKAKNEDPARLVLSISGVEGPKKNGDARGGCGQIIDTVAGCAPIEPWSVEQRDRLVEVWRRWHLNDMRAGCEHQRAEWDLDEVLEVVTYSLSEDARRDRRHLVSVAVADVVHGFTREWTPMQRALLATEPYATRHSAPDADDPARECWEISKREQKAARWVKPTEHPRGRLSATCAACGYRYGSAWLYEELPADVVEFVRGLPVDTSCPWGTYA